MVWLDNARILAIFAVVVLHTCAITLGANAVGTQAWWVANAFDSLVRWSVPVFVMVSGALLLDPASKDSLRTFYVKRVSKILIPTIVWTVIYLLWTVHRAEISGVDVEFSTLARKLVFGQPYYHMWYLYMIVSLYIFTPFLRKMFAALSSSEKTILILLLFGFAAVNHLAGKDSGIFFNRFLMYLPYFLLGYFIRSEAPAVNGRLMFTVFLILALATALGNYLFQLYGGQGLKFYFPGNLSVTVIPASICLFLLFTGWSKPLCPAQSNRTISTLTFGVYLVHPLVIDGLLHLGFNPASVYPLVTIPLVAAMAFSVSLGISWVFSRIPLLRRTI
ncbi:hypothetical protein E4634_10005 [Mangrovimicrobium sediminis]|uniref:Acyltransferase 3 domain-containing protein n=1 Tax=Mangrovimicrobium sediminis TaxID=2562682 RepID=A0A4Z0M1P6_9GAMM|nr:acyltransferase family protein [Haliea sp. SAOS-164]TGD73357.1 hypothetical protein E4634_10005 [Haliea sp. SAOS-164]